ncbi:MAG: F0F1 ATP synthase subunit B [Gammaproteobacteria bacterium]|nr:F0F1 ATP synthase subunit B [Gammaproteobacteria bacterium]
MHVNLTLVIQMAVFAVLIWFTMKFVWPMILGPMQERERRIAQGLAAADKGEEELERARASAESILREARERAGVIVDQAQRSATEILDQARSAATHEGQRLVAAAQEQIELDAARAKEQLRQQVGAIAVAAAAKLLEREIDAHAHEALLNEFAAQL